MTPNPTITRLLVVGLVAFALSLDPRNGAARAASPTVREEVEELVAQGKCAEARNVAEYESQDRERVKAIAGSCRAVAPEQAAMAREQADKKSEERNNEEEAKNRFLCSGPATVPLDSLNHLKTLPEDFENQTVTILGWASGDLERLGGDVNLSSFTDLHNGRLGLIATNKELAREWLSHTRGSPNAYSARVFLGVKNRTIHVLKICAFTTDGKLTFETHNYRFVG